MGKRVADVIIANKVAKLDRVFQYAVPEDLAQQVKVGCRVQVPFGMYNNSTVGFIVGLDNPLQWEESKIKPIKEVLDEKEAISEELIELAFFMKDRYLATLSSCLQAIIPKQFILEEKYIRLGTSPEAKEAIENIPKRNKRQIEIIRYLSLNPLVPLKRLRAEAGATSNVLNRLMDQGIIEYAVPDHRKELIKVLKEEPYVLNEEQRQAFLTVEQGLREQCFNEYLLHGVTGSGKTEVYMQLIEKVIHQGKSAIVLVPEISLTPQMVDKFTRRFGDLVGVTHSRLNATERTAVWNDAKNHKIKIVLGPRSAVFTPFDKLGLIIIDEEHELTYKSDTHPKYHTEEVARERCRVHNGVLLLGSATPSLPTYYRASKGEINYIPMLNRVNGTYPHIELVDMRIELEEGNRGMFSQALYEGIQKRLDLNQQVILFINRRGHSTFVSCRKCGFVFKCDLCELPYTYHVHNHTMVCHHCGQHKQMSHNCPECGSKYVKYFGVGTQKVQQHIHKLFPQARIIRMDLDTTTRKNSHEQYYRDFIDRKADILIGTQMIAKGLDFPGVTLVGVVAADLSLYTSDYRAAERTFQLLTQVAGRAGRSDEKGEVIIQTYSPEHYALQSTLKHDYNMFYDEEIQFREAMEYPPYSHILTFLIQHTNEELVIESAHYLASILKYYGESRGFYIIGPSPAHLSKLKNVYRWHIIVKHKDYNRLKNYAEYCLNKYNDYNKGVLVNFDLNPSMIQ